jgi:hypothetical protein
MLGGAHISFPFLLSPPLPTILFPSPSNLLPLLPSPCALDTALPANGGVRSGRWPLAALDAAGLLIGGSGVSPEKIFEILYGRK